MLKRLQWLILICAGPVCAAERVFEFGETAVDKTPAGFRSTLAGEGKPGEWKVILDEVPPLLAPLSDKAPVVTRRAVLAQTSRDATDERFPMLIFEGDTYGDFTLTTRFKLVAGDTEQMAGIAFRLQDERNFYVIRASGLGNNIRFYKMVGGVRSNPIGPEVPLARGVWHDLVIQCKANQIQCWLNGQMAIPPLIDNSFFSGQIAFWTKSDAVSYFADTKLVYTPRVPLAHTLVTEMLKKHPRLVDLKIYTRGPDGEPRVSGSKDEKEVGSAGGKYEKDCMALGTVFHSRDQETVSVVMPLKDNNGDPVAAVRLRMNAFPGQMEQTSLARARPIVKAMQARVQTAADLAQ
jgi:hypothetical protein